MPTFKLSHLEARDFICCCCGIKLKSRKKIMPSEETKVKLYCKPVYDSALREQPTGLCSSCRLDLFASARRVQWGGRNPNPRENTPLHAGRQCWGKSILPQAGYGLGTYRTVDIFNFSLISLAILEKLRFLCFYIIKSMARKGYCGPKSDFRGSKIPPRGASST